MSGTPERILTARGAWLVTRGAWLAASDWLAAMGAHEAHRIEVNRLWLEYLELADPVRARKIGRILKHGEQGAAKTADELLPPDAAGGATYRSRAGAVSAAQKAPDLARSR
jgi:hypothetical protein